MWVKFEAIPSDGDILYLPSSWPDKLNANAQIKFGGGDAVLVSVRYTEDLEYSQDNTFEEPFILRISYTLCRQLHLPTTLVYRMKIEDSCIFIGPVIGFMLGIHTHCYNPKHMQKYSDRMGIYHQIGGLIYAFSPKSINWDRNEAFGLYYNTASAEWEYGCFPLPEVIYRRDFHSDPSYIQKLIAFTGGRLFNSYRFTKMELYDYLSLFEETNGFLPPTEPSVNFEQVSKFISRHRKVILKPVDLSRGRGMCIIEKFDSFYQVTDYRYKQQITSILSDQSALEQFFSLNQDFFHKYLIQKYLNLAKIGNAIFDIRVVMQKHEDKTWGCTGIECRASSNSHITNISRGGFALTLEEALQKAFVKEYEFLPDRIIQLCRVICEKLDEIGHHFAELGIDIAVDENKRIWLIEANVFPSFKGFKRTDRNTYLAIRYTPLLYALSLTRYCDLPGGSHG